MKKILPLLLITIALFSCSNKLMLQRRYTKGVYISKNSRLHPQVRADRKIHRPMQGKTVNDVLNRPLVASKYNELVPMKTPVKSLGQNDNCSDTIVLNNKQKIACHVETVTETQLKYKHCLETSILKIMSLENISSVKYYNGVTEKFPVPNTVSPANNQKPASTHSPANRQEKRSYYYHRGENFSIFGHAVLILCGLIACVGAPPVGLLIIGFAIFSMVLIKGDFRKNNGTVKGLIVVGCIMGGLFLLAFVLSVIAIVGFA